MDCLLVNTLRKYGTNTIVVRTPEQRGTSCLGVRGITGEDLSSKVIDIPGTYILQN
jgi:hypothetical protein